MELDYAAAALRKDIGIANSDTSADNAHPDWKNNALACLTQFAHLTNGPFLIEQARQWAEANGLPSPPDARSWGGVTQAASRAKTIIKCGAAPAATSNCSLKPLWIVTS